MNDPIVDEVRRVRDAYAARFNYDLNAMFADLKEKERASGLKVVTVGESERQNKKRPSAGIQSAMLPVVVEDTGTAATPRAPRP